MSDGIAGDDIEGLVAVRRLIEIAKPGDIVICRDHDRLGRDMLESALHIRAIVKDKRARVFYYHSGEEAKADTAMDEMMSVFRSFSAQAELEKIRARTREALRARVKQARVAGGACYGYRLEKVADGTTAALIDGEQATVIRRIFDEYLASEGYKAIAIALNNERVPAPRASRRGTGSWSPVQVRDILRRERYAGWYVHGRINRVKKGGKRVAVKADPSQVMRVAIEEWRIIDELTWARAQEAARQRSCTLDPSKGRAVNQLAGIVRCGLCGGPIGVVNTKVSGGVGVRAYGCVWRHTRGPSVCENTMRRPTTVVEEALADAIKVAIERPDVVHVLMTPVRREVEKQVVDAASVDTVALEAQLLEAKRQHRNLLRVLATIDDEDAGLTAEIKVLGARVKELENSLSLVSRAPVEAAAYIAQAEATVRQQLAHIGEPLKASPEMTRDFYREVLDEMTLTPSRNDERPRRVIVEGAVRLVKAEVTPPCRHAR